MAAGLQIAGEIKCVFFSEFHHIAGPKISYQVPEDFPLRDAFDAVHELIITKPKLYNRLISVDVSGYRIVGCPKCIVDDNKYERNAFIFNSVFVFDSTTDTSPYEPVIQKLGDAFKTYESESSFLSSDSTRERLLEILTCIRDKLNSCGFCTIDIDDTNCLHLKITPSLHEPPEVRDYQVPIFTCTREDIVNTSWDLTIEQFRVASGLVDDHAEEQVSALLYRVGEEAEAVLTSSNTTEILPYVNGFNHVKKIAAESEVDIDIVQVCIQHLVLYGFLKLISIFQYSNVYVSMPKLKELLTDSDLKRECLEYVALPGHSPTVADVFRLYCSLEAGLTVRDLCMRSDPRTMGIDERMLIQYGLMREFIRHLQKYPVLLSQEEELPTQIQQITQYLDGSHCFDEVCCAMGIPNQELENWIENSPNLIICWK